MDLEPATRAVCGLSASDTVLSEPVHHWPAVMFFRAGGWLLVPDPNCPNFGYPHLSRERLIDASN
jgi:hypothetical protein